MGALRLRDIHKSFGSVEVLKGIDIEVDDGEFIIFVGPSGCGKSTLLRIIAGLEDATSGLVEIDRAVVNFKPPSKRGIAMVFQSYALYPHLSVRENMSLGLKQAKKPETEIRQRVVHAANMLSLEEYLDRRPAELSGGQRQRVAIGRSIVRKPSLFLFDEPLSNLDAALRVNTRLEIAGLHRELKSTMIYVTHDQTEAMTLADRIVVLNDGYVEQIGSPMDLYNNPANLFVAGFMGSPPMNFIEGEVKNNRMQSAGIDLPLTGSLEDKKVTLGFRPEDTEVVAQGKGFFDADVYAVEMTGEQTLVTITLNGAHFVVKMPKEYNAEMKSTVGVRFSSENGYLFDTASGLRIASTSVA